MDAATVQWSAGGGWLRRSGRCARKASRRCGAHPAIFLRQGEARRDRDHVLCPRCWRSELDRNVARLLLAS